MPEVEAPDKVWHPYRFHTDVTRTGGTIDIHDSFVGPRTDGRHGHVRHGEQRTLAQSSDDQRSVLGGVSGFVTACGVQRGGR